MKEQERPEAMTAKLGSLQLDIGANIAKLKSDMGKIEKGVNKSSKSMVKSANLVKTAFAGIFTGVVLKQVIDFGAALVNEADKMEELSITTGVTVENLSRLGYVASQSKTDINTLANGLRILGKNVDDTAMNIGQAQTAFKRLNIDVRDSNGELKDIDDLFMEIASNINTLNSTTEQAAVAQKLFGKSGAQLIPILKKGSEGIQELKDKADELGTTISTGFAEKAGILNDEIDTMKKAFEGVARDALPPLIEGLTDGATAITDMIKSYKEFSDSEFGSGFISFIEEGKRLNDFIQGNTNPLVVLMNAMRKYKEEVKESEAHDDFSWGLTNKLRADFEDGKNIAQDGTEALTDILTKGFDDALDEDTISKIMDIDALKEWEVQAKKLNSTVKGIDIDSLLDMEAIEGFVAMSKSMTESIYDVALANYNTADAAFKQSMSNVGRFADGFGNYVSNLTDDTKQDFGDMVVSILKDMVKLKATRLFTNIFAGAFGITAPSAPLAMPKLASGGVAMAATFAEIGEGADPEAVLPLARVNGKLGVRAAGGGGGGGMTVYIHNNGNNSVTATPSSDGSRLDIVIEDMLLQALNSGNADSIMKSRYGVLNKGVSR